MVSDYPFLIRGAGDTTFLRHVADFIERNEDRFTPNKAAPTRRKWLRMTAGDIDPAIATKKLELVDRFGITNWITDPIFDDLIGWIGEGGFVHAHTDGAQAGRMHIRMNLLVSRPEGGCVPVLDGIPIDVALGDAWLCFASACRHSTTPVTGKQRRSIISYGLQVENGASFPLYARYLTWKAAHGEAAASATA